MGIESIRSSQAAMDSIAYTLESESIVGGVLPQVRRAGTSVRPKEGRQGGGF